MLLGEDSFRGRPHQGRGADRPRFNSNSSEERSVEERNESLQINVRFGEQTSHTRGRGRGRGGSRGSGRGGGDRGRRQDRGSFDRSPEIGWGHDDRGEDTRQNKSSRSPGNQQFNRQSSGLYDESENWEIPSTQAASPNKNKGNRNSGLYDEQENWEETSKQSTPPYKNKGSRNSGLYDEQENWEEPRKQSTPPHKNKGNRSSGLYDEQENWDVTPPKGGFSSSSHSGRHDNSRNWDDNQQSRNTNKFKRYSGSFEQHDDTPRTRNYNKTNRHSGSFDRDSRNDNQRFNKNRNNRRSGNFDDRSQVGHSTGYTKVQQKSGLYDESENWEDDASPVATNKVDSGNTQKSMSRSNSAASQNTGLYDASENWEDVDPAPQKQTPNAGLYDQSENWETDPAPAVEFKAMPSEDLSSPSRKNWKTGTDRRGDRKFNKAARTGRRTGSAHRQMAGAGLSADAPEWTPPEVNEHKRPKNKPTGKDEFHDMPEEADQLEWHYTEDPGLYNTKSSDLTESNLNKLNKGKKRRDTDDDLNNSAESLERFIAEHTLCLDKDHGIGIAPITTVTSSEDDAPVEQRKPKKKDWVAMMDSSSSDLNTSTHSQNTSDLDSSAGFKSPAKSSRSTDDDVYLDANASTPEQLDDEKPKTVLEHVKEQTPIPESSDKEQTPVPEDYQEPERQNIVKSEAEVIDDVDSVTNEVAKLDLEEPAKDDTGAAETGLLCADVDAACSDGAKTIESSFRHEQAEGQEMKDNNMQGSPCRSSTPIQDEDHDNMSDLPESIDNSVGLNNNDNGASNYDEDSAAEGEEFCESIGGSSVVLGGPVESPAAGNDKVQDSDSVSPSVIEQSDNVEADCEVSTDNVNGAEVEKVSECAGSSSDIPKGSVDSAQGNFTGGQSDNVEADGNVSTNKVVTGADGVDGQCITDVETEQPECDRVDTPEPECDRVNTPDVLQSNEGNIHYTHISVYCGFVSAKSIYLWTCFSFCFM